LSALLNIVKRLVELQGGEVSVESAGRGLGATFSCRFPIVTRQAEQMVQMTNATTV
jgi:signal transduction histidine kinase